MRRIVVALLVPLCLVVAACETAEDEPEGPKPLDASQVMKMKYQAPADGKLTRELLDHYVMVIEEQRRVLEEDGNLGALDKLGADATARQRKSRSKLLYTARIRALQEKGMPMTQFTWLKKTIVKARIAANRKAGPETTEGANAGTLKDFEAGYGSELPTDV